MGPSVSGPVGGKLGESQREDSSGGDGYTGLRTHRPREVERLLAPSPVSSPAVSPVPPSRKGSEGGSPVQQK